MNVRSNDIIDSAFNVSSLIEELSLEVRFQSAIEDIDDDDLEQIVKRAIRRLYIDTGRALEYNTDLYEYSRGILYFNKELKADEQEYVLICSKIGFFDMVSKAYSDMFSYTTNALTVANGDKPYQNMQKILNDLEEERRKVYYAMCRFWGDVAYEV